MSHGPATVRDFMVGGRDYNGSPQRRGCGTGQTADVALNGGFRFCKRVNGVRRRVNRQPTPYVAGI